MRPTPLPPRVPNRPRFGRFANPIAALVAAFALIVGLAACTSRPAALQDAPPVPTEEATFDTSAIEAASDALLAAGAPAVLVEVRDGDEVWRSSMGVTTVTGSERPDKLAPVRVASVTKSMIGTMLMQLVAEGRLDLDAPLSTYLPDLRLGREVVADPTGTPELEASPTPTGPDWTAPADTAPSTDTVPDGAALGTDVVFDGDGTPILDPTTILTPRMLAQHTAGVPDYIGTFPLTDLGNVRDTLEHEYGLGELIERVGGLHWTNAPGAAFHYSNTNYLVLSMVIEALTGEPVGDAFDAYIAKPADLTSTSLPTAPDLPAGGAHGYFTIDGLYLDVTRQSGTLWSGAGGVVSTVGDVNTFYRALLQGVYLGAADLHEVLALNDDGYGLGVQGHVDPCGPGDPVYLAGAEPGTTPSSATTAPPGAAGAGPTPVAGAVPGERAPEATEAPTVSPVPGAAASPGAAPSPGVTTTSPASTLGGPVMVQIGEPGMTYGHIGSGLGYRILSFSSPDGLRQVTVAWTASPVDYAADPRIDPAWQVVDAGLAATCPA